MLIVYLGVQITQQPNNNKVLQTTTTKQKVCKQHNMFIVYLGVQTTITQTIKGVQYILQHTEHMFIVYLGVQITQQPNNNKVLQI